MSEMNIKTRPPAGAASLKSICDWDYSAATQVQSMNSNLPGAVTS